MKIVFFPFIRKKTLYTENLMKNRARAIIVVGNICGLLDLVRADPTTAINSQYRIGDGARGHNIREM